MLKRSAFWVGTALAAMAIQVAAAIPASAAEHYGGYASGSPDSSTCGGNWAQDTYVRHFTVSSSGGVLTVVEDFKDGSFVTVAGSSPGGCDTNPGGTVAAGVTGSMHGYFVIPMPGETQVSSDPSCVVGDSTADCTTAGFINSHFSPACYPNVCTVTTFLFHYSAGGQALAFNEWKNASADRGGNSGDISST
jgi:hypothetical protein